MTYLASLTYLRTLVLAIAIGLVAWSCGGDDDDDVGAQADAGAAEDLDMTASDFACILDGTKLHKFFLWNPLGHLDDAARVANSTSGGTYPVGTIIQLLPVEAMVKRRAGWSPTTADWEFFALEVSGTGTSIAARGTEDVMNMFGGNCFECHSKAEARWDMVCETAHGCEPLPFGDDAIEMIQNADSRCGR
jgi:hypothetical protein